MSERESIELQYGRPMYVMAKPVGAACNLQCSYCYYLEKSRLYDASSQLMSDEMLELFIREYIHSQTTLEVLFTWHGGEPLLRPISFYERALELQRQYANGRRIANCIQTNATLIDDEWCEFFRKNNFLVGVSIDGPQTMHDSLRTSRRGESSYRDVMRGLRLLNRHRVEWNAMATVNAANVEHPMEFYRFFRDELECQFLQFTPVVERICQTGGGESRLMHAAEPSGEVVPYSVTAEQWGRFLCAIFDEWVRHDVGRMFVQLFDSTLANWVGEAVGVCAMSKYCGHAAVIEHNGDVYSCDHFVFPEYKLGNLNEKSLSEMMYGRQQSEFGEAKHRTLPRQCRECEYEFACHGECPRNRFLTTADDEPGLNYLCTGYYAFFSHAATAMDYMRRQLQQGRPPANV
ncbi:MAG: anaerobic sulfatase-maturation protein, partial [Alistipes sp.]|nr:anaerobic sulfatase-maturation protein [Alistipes sp.]